MISDIEKRSVIKFLLLRKIEPDEIMRQLSEAYGEEAPSRSTTYKWIKEFKCGRTNVHDEERSGRPREIGEEKLEKLKNIVRNERKATKEQLANALNVSYGTVHNMLHTLGVRKLCSRFVPYFLNADMCEKRLQCCQENLNIHAEIGARFLDNIVTEDETPLSLYIPEDRRSSKEWKLPGEVSSRKLRSGFSQRREVMMTIFWDSRGVVHTDFADKATKINGEYYARVVEEARKKRRKPYGQTLFLLHDNAPVHKSAVAQAAVQRSDFVELSHPPYSPDLAPRDCFLFCHLKKHLKGKRFADKEEVMQAATSFLSEKPADWYKSAFSDLVRRWNVCVENDGGYVEK